MKKVNVNRVMKIGVATSDWSGSVFSDRGWPVMGGAAWIRFGQLLDKTKNHIVIGGLQIVGGEPCVQTFDGRIHSDCSVVVIQRQMGKEVPQAISNAISNGKIVINDVDDWFWGLHPENKASKAVNPKLNKDSNIDHYKESLVRSSLVTVSTPFLEKKLLDWGCKVKLLENKVSVNLFKMRRHSNTRPIVGWCGSTNHRSGDLKILKEPFKLAQAQGIKLFFHHTGELKGAPTFASEVGVKAPSVTTLPLLAPSEYPNGFCFDIGVVPLTDCDFNNAKSWIKGIEYAAAGIPFIASPSDEYVRLHDEYAIGRLAESPREWADHLVELSDFHIRSTEGSRIRNVVLEEMNSFSMAKSWDDIFWGVVK